MLRKIHIRLAGILALAALMLHIGGCSAVGFATGALIDEASNSKTHKESWQVGSITKGKNVTVYLRDGALVEGNYRGLYDVEDHSYNVKYAGAVSNIGPKVSLPAIKDSISVVVGEATYRDNCFTGFGYNYRKSQKRSDSDKLAACFYISSEVAGNPGESRFYLDRVTQIYDFKGDSTRGYTINKLIENGHVPLKTGARIAAETGSYKVPIEDIEYIEYRTKNAKWVFLGLGLVIDALIVIAVASADWEGPSGQIDLSGAYDF